MGKLNQNYNKENKIFHILMAVIILITIMLILFVHIFNTSEESIYPIENYMTCE